MSLEQIDLWIEDFLMKLQPREGRREIPIILVGNKLDVLDKEQMEDWELCLEEKVEEMRDMIRNFEDRNPEVGELFKQIDFEVLGWRMVSAKTGKGVLDLFQEPVYFCTQRPDQLRVEMGPAEDLRKSKDDSDCC